MIETINDEFVIENAEMINDNTKTILSVSQTIRSFITQNAVEKILLLKGKKNSPFIRIEIINDQLSNFKLKLIH